MIRAFDMFGFGNEDFEMLKEISAALGTKSSFASTENDANVLR